MRTCVVTPSRTTGGKKEKRRTRRREGGGGKGGGGERGGKTSLSIIRTFLAWCLVVRIRS
eukprot:321593-Pyramimonas_sp.AAC.1